MVFILVILKVTNTRIRSHGKVKGCHTELYMNTYKYTDIQNQKLMKFRFFDTELKIKCLDFEACNCGKMVRYCF